MKKSCLFALPLLFLLAGCGDEDIQPSRNYANLCASDPEGTVEDENNWIRSWSHETYLWYDELPNIHPSSENNPIAYFNKMKTSAITASGKPKDRFHYTQKTENTQTSEEGKFYLRNTENYRQFSKLGFSTGFGLKILVVKSTPPRQILVAHTEPESPAALKQIARGTEIIAINGIDIKNGSTEDYNLAMSVLFPQNTGEFHKFVIKDANKNYNRAVIMQSTQVKESPIISKIIQENNRNIGYMALSTFGTVTVELELIDAIKEFLGEQPTTEDGADTSENTIPEAPQEETKPLDDLVLDLRYNGGGYLDISAQLAAMIVGDNGRDKLYGEIIHNDKRIIENVWVPYPTIAMGLSAPEGSDLPMLNLQRVYIISTGNTASASEYLINGLRGIDIEVILIGEKTLGKPYGFVPKDNCGTTYFTIQFEGKNSKGFGDYADGLIPSDKDDGAEVLGCKVADDLSQPLGNPNEKMLATALYHIENQSCPTDSLVNSEEENNPLSKIHGKILRPYPTEMILR